MKQFILKPTKLSDVESIHELYKEVARIPGGLARLEREIDTSYIDSFVESTCHRGIGYLAYEEDKLIGEIHAYRPALFCFSHVLSDVTIAVHPDAQGKGVGRLLFNQLMTVAINQEKTIERIELFSRESNEKAIRFYTSLGFRIEGRLRNRIKRMDGHLEDDLVMAWERSTNEQ